MYAMCPNCENTVPDHGNEPFIVCDKCAEKIRSRVYFNSRSKSRSRRSIYHNSRNGHSSGQDRVQPGEVDWAVPDYITRGRQGPHSSPFKTLIGFFCSLAIVFFIIVVLLNFLSFFAAFAFSAPQLVNEHEVELEAEITLVIDNTPPDLGDLQDVSITSTPGEPISLKVNISDPQSGISESYLELPWDMSHKIYLTNNNIISFQAPATPGMHQPTLTAIDHAGNMARAKFSLNVRESTKPFVMLTEPTQYAVIRSSTVLEFTPSTNNISNITYTLDRQLSNVSLIPPYHIDTTGWTGGPHQLNLTIDTNSNSMNMNMNTQNFSIVIDDTEPSLTTLSIRSLTIDREDAFKDRLNETTFYRGEFVRISVFIRDENLASAQVSLDNKTYTLTPVLAPPANPAISSSSSVQYHTILTLPHQPDKYSLDVFAIDLAGNTQKHSQTFHVVRINFDYIPVPIIEIDLPMLTNDPTALPVINSSTNIEISTLHFDSMVVKRVELEYHYTQGTQLELSNTTGQENVTITGLPVGEGVLRVHSRIVYINWDYLFITVPYPPYLVVMPFILTGTALLGFYIFIGLAIIFSNLYLFKSSMVDAVNQIKNAFLKLNGPLIDSKNTFIMLAQLFMAVLAFSIIYNYFLAWNQIPTHTPDFAALSTWTLIYNLTSAAVFEEIISRILLIGVPLLIIHLLRKNVQKNKHNYILGGGFELNKLTIILIVFSSVTFGLAHAPGWDYWKVVPSLVSGLALGYLFVKKGIYASIILHFTINFLSIPLRMLDYPLGPTILFSFLILFWILIGAVYCGYYFIKIIDHFRFKRPAHRVDMTDVK